MKRRNLTRWLAGICALTTLVFLAVAFDWRRERACVELTLAPLFQPFAFGGPMRLHLTIKNGSRSELIYCDRGCAPATEYIRLKLFPGEYKIRLLPTPTPRPIIGLFLSARLPTGETKTFSFSIYDLLKVLKPGRSHVAYQVKFSYAPVGQAYRTKTITGVLDLNVRVMNRQELDRQLLQRLRQWDGMTNNLDELKETLEYLDTKSASQALVPFERRGGEIGLLAHALRFYSAHHSRSRVQP